MANEDWSTSKNSYILNLKQDYVKYREMVEATAKTDESYKLVQSRKLLNISKQNKTKKTASSTQHRVIE